MKTTIVIVTYNGMPWIDRCLQSTGNYPVVVVDNASTDQTAAHIQTNYPKVTLLPQVNNLGFGQGNNTGISFALKQGAEQVFLLNQDAYLVEECLHSLINKQQQYPEFGILSPIHLNGKGDALDSNFGNYISYQKVPKMISDLLINKAEEIYEVPFVNAAGWLLSRKCLKTVGGFDPIFFHYGEDDNYCQRVFFHGFKIGVVINAFLSHDRENRQIKPVVKFSNEYYQQLERRYKLIYADVNMDVSAIQKEITRLKKIMVKQFFKFQFSNGLQTKKKLKLLVSLQNNLSKSRTINLQKGLHYIE